LPWFLLRYHGVLAVQTLRTRSACSASRASRESGQFRCDMDATVTGQFRPQIDGVTNISKLTLYINDQHTTTGYREATLEEIMTGARHALSLRVRRGTVFTSPKITADYLTARLAELPYEVFTLIYIDKRHRFIACEDLFRGTIDVALYLARCLSTALKCLQMQCFSFVR
jgi:hypothetical protein